MIDVSLCTSCMNRNSNLEKAIISWIKLPISEIIIVDWSCDNPLNYLKNLDKRIVIVRVDDKKYYHHSAANNLKIKHARFNWILSVDADILINEDFFSEYKLEEEVIYRGRGRKNDGIYGFFLSHKKWIDKIGGFNEKLDSGWGYEDDDFYLRLKKENVKIFPIYKQWLNHITHTDEERIKYTKIKDKNLSWKKNLELSNNYSWSSKDLKMKYNEIIYD